MIEQLGPIHVAHGAGTTYRARGGLYTLVLSSSSTGGAYSLWEACNEPGTGVPPHIQHREDESFYILEGRYTFWTPQGEAEYGPGDSLLVRRGLAHGFVNDGPARARMLILQSPGGIHEGYFAEAWEVVDPSNLPPEPAPDFGKIKAAAERAGIELLPPR